MGSLDGDSIDGDFPYDNMSQSSYGSHKNRNFESRSHQGVGSLDELRNWCKILVSRIHNEFLIPDWGTLYLLLFTWDRLILLPVGCGIGM